jgi:hypothetical protein
MWPIVSDEVRDTLVAGAVVDAIRTTTGHGELQQSITPADVFDLRARLLSRLESGVLGVQLMTDARRAELGRLPGDPEVAIARRIAAAGADLAVSELQESLRLRAELAQLSNENARILSAQTQLVRDLSEIGQTQEAIEAERYQRVERERRLDWGRWTSAYATDTATRAKEVGRE